MSYKIAILGYETINIGDEIQSIALRRAVELAVAPGTSFASSTVYYVNRDNMTQVLNEKYEKIQLDPAEKILLIINGWHGAPKIFPPPSHFIPVFVSAHFTAEFLIKIVDKQLSYFRGLPEIGCRDDWTYNQLKSRQIKARLDGCMTLTLDPPICPNLSTDKRVAAYIKPDAIYYVDTPKGFIDKEKQKYPHAVHIPVTHIIPRNKSPTEARDRFEIAETLLYLYSKAHRVYTSRLHCYLPCKAMGVDVVLVGANMKDPRFANLAGRDTAFYASVKTRNRELVRGILADPVKYTSNML